MYPFQAIAASGDDVWINAQDDQGWALLRIDTERNVVAERIAASPGWGMAIAGNHLWLTTQQDTVEHYDVETGDLLAAVRAPNPLGITATEDAAWAASGGAGTLTRVDARTNKPTYYDTGAPTGTMPILVDDELWLTTLYGAEVLVIDPTNGEVIERIRTQWPKGITVHDGVAWVLEEAREGAPQPNQRVIAIDVASREIIRELPVPGLMTDRGIYVNDDSVWIVVAEMGLVRLDL